MKRINPAPLKRCGIKFGTDGWRGIIGKDFNLKNVEAVAQAISDYLTQYAIRNTQYAKVVVGYDTRRLSREAAKRIAQVLTTNKIKVILSDRPLPTQTVSFTVRQQKCTAGIMVTASHNPARFNGIKIKGPFGGAVENKVTDAIEKNLFRRRPEKMPLHLARRKGLLKKADLVSPYLKFLQSYLDMPLLKKGRLKVLIDSMHGTGNGYIAAVLKESGCKITTIHRDFNSSFGGIKPEPIQSCLKEASAVIKRGHFDIGLATDGDGDRIAALDSQGGYISPQQIISLLLLHFIRNRKLKGAVVKTIAGTSLLERIAKKYKLKIYETPVGFKHIAALMLKKDILIGGEEAGGIGFKNYLPERDGMLGGLLLLEMLLAENKSIKALLEETEKEFGRYCYLRKDFKCLPHDKDKVKARLANLRKRKSFLRIKINKVKAHDGLKFYLASGSWILFRLSGTEPVLRIYAEADNLAKTRSLIVEGEKILNE